MRALLVLGVLAFAFGSAPVRADWNDGNHDGDDHHHCPDCVPETKDVCFNLVCHFDFDRDHGHDLDHGHDHDGDDEIRHCTVASTFTKAVTKDGGEFQDVSNEHNNPSLEVSCGEDQKKIFSNSARRFTDLLGTRIQGETGPTPALLLPRGALHTTADGRGGGHYTRAALELDLARGFKRGKGECFVWTGFP